MSNQTDFGFDKVYLGTADGRIIAELDITNVRFTGVNKDGQMTGAMALNLKLKHEFVFTPTVRLKLIGRECEEDE